jgi:hypothetical protein
LLVRKQDAQIEFEIEGIESESLVEILILNQKQELVHDFVNELHSIVTLWFALEQVFDVIVLPLLLQVKSVAGDVLKAFRVKQTRSGHDGALFAMGNDCLLLMN